MQPSYDSQKEGRILLAIQVFNSGQFKSLYAASRAFNVSKDTLAPRYYSTLSRRDSQPHSLKLTYTEEEVLL